MTEVVHADVFFFITSVVVVVLGVGVAVVLYYLVCILRDVRAILATGRRMSETLERDFNVVHKEMLHKGGQMKHVFDLGLQFIAGKFGRPPRRKKAESPSE